MSQPIEPQHRICQVDGKWHRLIREGSKNCRVCKMDVEGLRTVGKSFLVEKRHIENFATADTLIRATSKPTKHVSLPVEPQHRICQVDGKWYRLERQGPKNCRVYKMDGENRCTVEESFLVKTNTIQKITTADALLAKGEIPKLTTRPTQTIRLDAEVAVKLQDFAARHGESINDAIVHLLQRANETAE